MTKRPWGVLLLCPSGLPSHEEKILDQMAAQAARRFNVASVAVASAVPEWYGVNRMVLESMLKSGVRRLLLVPLFPPDESPFSSQMQRLPEAVRRRWPDLHVEVVPPLIDTGQLEDRMVDAICLREEDRYCPAAMNRADLGFDEDFCVADCRTGFEGLSPLCAEVVRGVVEATADVRYLRQLAVSEADVQAGVDALRRGADVVFDTPCTRAVAGQHCPEASHPNEWSEGSDCDSTCSERVGGFAGSVVVVGVEPACVERVLEAAGSRANEAPALTVAFPASLSRAAGAKRRLRASGLACITNEGPVGGPVAASAVLGVLWRIAARVS